MFFILLKKFLCNSCPYCSMKDIGETMKAMRLWMWRKTRKINAMAYERFIFWHKASGRLRRSLEVKRDLHMSYLWYGYSISNYDSYLQLNEGGLFMRLLGVNHCIVKNISK